MSTISATQSSACPVCGSRHATPLGSFQNWHRTFFSVACSGCALVYVSPQPTPEFVASLFTDHYFENQPHGFWGVRRLPVFRDAERVLRRLACRSVYDVGTAHGDFVAYLAWHGYRAAGCDLSRTACERAVVDVRQGTLHTAPPPFEPDAITVLDTLYYSPDPAADLKAAHAYLPPGGVLLLRLRNNMRAHAKGRSGRPAPYEHLWAFTPRLAVRMVERAGFAAVRAEPAMYSRHRLSAPLNVAARLNRAILLPPLTQSFHVIARKPEHS